jgi:hypothetical protein
MPLSEFEKRELDRIGEELQHEDPRLSSLLNGDTLLHRDRLRSQRGVTFLAVGLFLMVAGQALHASVLVLSGFALLCLGSFWAVRAVQNMLDRGNRPKIP